MKNSFGKGSFSAYEKVIPPLSELLAKTLTFPVFCDILECHSGKATFLDEGSGQTEVR
jgi:hypothetical protein